MLYLKKLIPRMRPDNTDSEKDSLLNLLFSIINKIQFPCHPFFGRISKKRNFPKFEKYNRNWNLPISGKDMRPTKKKTIISKKFQLSVTQEKKIIFSPLELTTFSMHQILFFLVSFRFCIWSRIPPNSLWEILGRIKKNCSSEKKVLFSTITEEKKIKQTNGTLVVLCK